MNKKESTGETGKTGRNAQATGSNFSGVHFRLHHSQWGWPGIRCLLVFTFQVWPWSKEATVDSCAPRVSLTTQNSSKKISAGVSWGELLLPCSSGSCSYTLWAREWDQKCLMSIFWPRGQKEWLTLTTATQSQWDLGLSSTTKDYFLFLTKMKVHFPPLTLWSIIWTPLRCDVLANSPGEWIGFSWSVLFGIEGSINFWSPS